MTGPDFYLSPNVAVAPSLAIARCKLYISWLFMHLTILHQFWEFTLKSVGRRDRETRTEGNINLITGSVTYSDNDNRGQ